VTKKRIDGQFFLLVSNSRPIYNISITSSFYPGFKWKHCILWPMQWHIHTETDVMTQTYWNWCNDTYILLCVITSVSVCMCHYISQYVCVITPVSVCMCHYTSLSMHVSLHQSQYGCVITSVLVCMCHYISHSMNGTRIWHQKKKLAIDSFLCHSSAFSYTKLRSNHNQAHTLRFVFNPRTI
jgi:hypothetical protein